MNIFLNPNVGGLRFFKLRILLVKMIYILIIKGLYHEVALTYGLEHMSLWQTLNFLSKISHVY